MMKQTIVCVYIYIHTNKKSFTLILLNSYLNYTPNCDRNL